MYEYYTKQIDRLIEAQEALTSGGVKSYTLGDMQITRFDMSRLSKEIEKAVEIFMSSLINGVTKNMKNKIEYIFPILLIILDLAAAAVYASQKDWKKTIYWIAAAVLNAAVTF